MAEKRMIDKTQTKLIHNESDSLQDYIYQTAILRNLALFFFLLAFFAGLLLWDSNAGCLWL